MNRKLNLEKGMVYDLYGSPTLDVKEPVTLVVNEQKCIVDPHSETSFLRSLPNLIAYTDEQISAALRNLVGKNNIIDTRQKWAWVHWHLIWSCNYPSLAKRFCQRIIHLPYYADIEIGCFYNNIRQLSTLSFMYQDPRFMANVKYCHHDKASFFQAREVWIALEVELQKQLLQIR